MKLAMTLPIKNHAYLIKQNILYHHTQGIDCFVVMLNNSEDDSEKILQELAKNIDIISYRKTDEIFMDAEFRLEMAIKARDILKADWIVNNDIDEFWITSNEKNLKSNLEELSTKFNTVYAERYNFIPYIEDGEAYKSPPESFKYIVNNPQKIDKSRPFSEISPLEFMLKTNAGKATCSLKGLTYIAAGSHEVQIENYSKTISDNLSILHYPFSTKETLKKEIYKKVENVLKDVTLKENQNWHVKLFEYLINTNNIETFINELFPDKDIITNLLAKNLITKETSIYDFFK